MADVAAELVAAHAALGDDQQAPQQTPQLAPQPIDYLSQHVQTTADLAAQVVAAQAALDNGQGVTIGTPNRFPALNEIISILRGDAYASLARGGLITNMEVPNAL